MNKAKRALSIIVGAICIFGAVGLTSCKKDGPSVGLEYTLSADGTYYAVTGMGECEAKKLIIPSKHEGLPVKSIGLPAEEGAEETAYPFMDAEVTSVVIPDSVTYIADYAFSYCDNLKSVSIPSTLTYFGDGAFYYCVQLQSEEYDGALYLGNKDNPYLILLHAEVTYGITECQVRDETKFIAGSAFENCKNLTEITFGAATQSIGSKAFSKCAALTSVTIPDTVTRLGERAFFECGALESAVIGSGVTKIETYSFYACRALKDVSLSASIERVSVAAFQGISDWALAEYDDVYYLGNDETPYLVVIGGSPSISSCTLHEQTKVLGDYAFNGFSRMKTVFVNRGLCFVGEGAFNGCQALTDIDFEGNETEWNGLAVHMSYNAPFFNATVEYNVR